MWPGFVHYVASWLRTEGVATSVLVACRVEGVAASVLVACRVEGGRGERFGTEIESGNREIENRKLSRFARWLACQFPIPARRFPLSISIVRESGWSLVCVLNEFQTVSGDSRRRITMVGVNSARRSYVPSRISFEPLCTCSSRSLVASATRVRALMMTTTR